jgi:sortase family protein
LREVERQRVAGFRVVVSWPQSRFAPPPRPSVNLRARIAGVAGVLLLVAGAVSVGIAIAVQQHAPQPSLAAAGVVGSAGGRGPSLRRSMPVSVKIPAIGVNSSLLHLGINRDGTIQVPSLYGRPNEAAWFKYSVTPGQSGASVIEGHVDTRQGPAVFFRLGALRPGNSVEVTLADGVTAVFRVTGVRQYQKEHFPSKIIYGASGYAALHLITCGGAFDYATGHYLSSTVVFATLASSRRAARRAA